MYSIKKIEINFLQNNISITIGIMSFVTTLAALSQERAAVVGQEKDEKRERFERAKEQRLDEMMTKLTEKYHPLITDALNQAAYKGHRQKHMNFDREDFKANFPTLGTPAEMAIRWLTMMVTEDSKYLPLKEDGKEGERMHFAGLTYDVWNNSAFTVKFSW